ncbi:MAG: RHS repeat-associated core domain-containing protein [Planctomycetota bacterium]|nr:RHS repeat-associated core domain-containing protein [Planctomycetota bacterium]
MLANKRFPRVLSVCILLGFAGSAYAQQDWQFAPDGIAKTPENNEPSGNGCGNADFADLLRQLAALAEGEDGDPMAGDEEPPAKDDKCKSKEDGDGGGGGQNDAGDPAPREPYDGMYGDLLDPDRVKHMLEDILRKLKDRVNGDPTDYSGGRNCAPFALSGAFLAKFNDLMDLALGTQTTPGASDACEMLGIAKQIAAVCRGDADEIPSATQVTGDAEYGCRGQEEQLYRTQITERTAFRREWMGVRRNPDIVVASLSTCSQCPPGEIKTELAGLQAAFSLGADEHGTLGYVLMRSDTLMGGNAHLYTSMLNGGTNPPTAGNGAANLKTRRTFEVELNLGNGDVDQVRDNIGGLRCIRQLRVKDLYVDFRDSVGDPSYDVEVRFFKGTFSKVADLYEFGTATPFRTVRTKYTFGVNAIAGQQNKYRAVGSYAVSDMPSSGSSRVATFRQGLDLVFEASEFRIDGNESWELSRQINTQTPEYRVEEVSGDSTYAGHQVITKTRSVYGPSSLLLSRERTYFRPFPGFPADVELRHGWPWVNAAYERPALLVDLVPVQHIVDPDGAALTSSWDYDTSGATQWNPGWYRLIGQSSPNGHWEEYSYDSHGWLNRKVSQYLDHPRSAGEAQNRVDEFGRREDIALFSESNGDQVPEEITWHSVRIMGAEVERTLTVHWKNTVQLDGSGKPVPVPEDETTIRCAMGNDVPADLATGTALRTWLQSVLTDPFATKHLVSHERRVSRDEMAIKAIRGRMDVKLDADGTVSKYFYRSYPLAPSTSAPSLADYGAVGTNASTPGMVVRRVRGPAALSGCFPLKPGCALMPRDGEVRVEVTGPNDQQLVTQTRDLQGELGVGMSRTEYPWTGTLLTDSTIATTWATDPFGRPTVFQSIDGAQEALAYSDCCGSGTTTDALGVITVTQKDEFGRVASTTQNFGTAAQLTTLYTYDALDRVIKTSRIGADNSVMVQSEVGYDAVGREAWTADQLGNITNYSYAISSGEVTTTTTLPDPDGVTGPLTSPTEIAVNFPDGRQKASGGTAAHATKTEYGVEADGLLGTNVSVQYVKSIALGEGSPASEDQWTKAYTDSLGRNYRSTAPAADGTSTVLEARTTFGSRGRRLSAIDAAGIRTIFLQGHGPEEAPGSTGTSDWSGDWSVEALDANADGMINFGINDTDRISRSRSFVTTRTENGNPVVVRRSESAIWDSVAYGMPSSHVVVTALADSSVDGRTSWSESFGLVTKSWTVEDAVAHTSTSHSLDPSGNESVSVSRFGRVETSVTYSGNTASGTLHTSAAFGFDAHGRQTTVTDTRGTPNDATDDRVTTTTYDNADRQVSTTLPLAEVGATPMVTTNTYDNLGRVIQVVAPSGTTHNEYDASGELKKSWGGESYPVEYTYDAAGRMKTLKTRQKSRDLDSAISQVTSDATAAVTTWDYDSKTGVLLQKLYPHATVAGLSGVGPSYTYFADGKLKRRTWARGSFAEYAYSAATGELLSITYSDGTPSVTYTYDRLGRPKTVIDGSGTRQFMYDRTGQPTAEEYTAGLLNGVKTALTYDSQLRRQNYTLTRGTNTLNAHTLGYDSLSRLNSVSRGIFSTNYSYVPHSNLVAGLQHKASTTVSGTGTITRDGLDRIKSMAWSIIWSSTATENYAYRYNAAGQRERAEEPDASYWKFQYDQLGQVISGRRYMPAGVAQTEADDLDVPGYRFGYAFDHIGNRTGTTATDGVPNFGTLPRLASYSANLLNQYTERSVPRALDISGYASGTITVDNQAVWRSGLAAPFDQYYWFPKEWPGVNTAFATGVNVSNLAQPLSVFLPATPEQFTYDLDGNLTQDGRWNYSWDGENRLIAMEIRDELKPLFTQPLRLEFSYDSQHRRVRKLVMTPMAGGGGGNAGAASSGGGSGAAEGDEVLTPSGVTGLDEGAMEIQPELTLNSTVNGGWSILTDIRFAWDGWLLSAELNNSGNLIRGYCWGIDLSGTRGGAAGIGGLLWAQEGGTSLSTSTLRYITSDVRGDVRGVYNRFAAQLGRFEYGPFGEPTAVAGSAASSFPIRFSSKYADQETGLSYFGRRFLAASAGRWIGRDPVGERDGAALNVFVRNCPIDAIDSIGLRRLVVGIKGAGTDDFNSINITGLWKQRLESTLGKTAKETDFEEASHDQSYNKATSVARRLTRPIPQKGKQSNGSCKYDTVVVLGYSWGAKSAVETVSDVLLAQKIRIDLIFIADPVKGVLTIDRFTKKKNVSVLRNFYQTSHVKDVSLIPGSRFKGNPIAGADENVLISGADWEPKNFSTASADPHMRQHVAHVTTVQEFADSGHFYVGLHNRTLRSLEDSVSSVSVERSSYEY